MVCPQAGHSFRGLVLAEFGHRPLRKAFYQSNDLAGTKIADPFMGGGTPLIEANRLGCDVMGFDINPMAYWIVKQEIEHLDLSAYKEQARRLVLRLANEVGHLYMTRCILCGDSAPVKYFLWVKQLDCQECGKSMDLFPGYLLAESARHPRNVYVCSECGALSERADGAPLKGCDHCRKPLVDEAAAFRNRCVCRHCGHANRYPRSEGSPPRHRLFAIEYHCERCRPRHEGRFFKAADAEDLSLAGEAERRMVVTRARFVPDDEIPAGDETGRLHKWGYRQYRQMFNARQLLGLELSARYLSAVKNDRVRNALATNLSDLLRYQNMLCRYDTMALKSLDVFSVHGFPVGLIQCESNLIGLSGESGAAIGSGGWANIVVKYRKAREYADHPFEIRHTGGRKEVIPIDGEWIGDAFGENGRNHSDRTVQLQCADAAAVNIPPRSLDAVFTDPPYYGNVQYAELMDFCYVWLRKIIDGTDAAFEKRSTRDEGELTGNVTLARGLESFASGLSSVFCRMVEALKPGGPLVFTFHHNELAAYGPVAMAILDAGLVCTAALPCPAEMSASIHISGTKSSIVDTVFVCRVTPERRRVEGMPQKPDGIADLVHKDMANLVKAGCVPSPGDTLCIINGHLTRMAIARLRPAWKAGLRAAERLERVSREFARMPEPQGIKDILDGRDLYPASVSETASLLDALEGGE